MKPLTRLLLVLLLLLPSLACSEEIEETDTGGVFLELSLGDTFPFRVPVNGNDTLQLDFEIQSIVQNPARPTSSLMNVQVESLQVTFQRIDGGTRVPPPFFRHLTGVVPVGGSLDYFLTVMTQEQFRNPPLSDLLFENGGFDKETGDPNIQMSLTFVFFGRTIGGEEVATPPRSHTFEFVP